MVRIWNLTKCLAMKYKNKYTRGLHENIKLHYWYIGYKLYTFRLQNRQQQ